MGVRDIGIGQKRQSWQAREDAQKRRRYGEHGRWETRQGRKSRMAEMPRGGLNEQQRLAWHEYVHRGGPRPGGGAGAAGGAAGGGAPTWGEMPTYEKPEYDESKVSAITQKRAAPGVRRLRETTQRAMGETYENPNVKRMTVRSALAGYGTGLEGVISGAGRAATAEYGQEYAADVNAAMAEYQGALRQRSQEYDTASRAWLMGQQQQHWQQQQDYQSDPYADFESFYS